MITRPGCEGAEIAAYPQTYETGPYIAPRRVSKIYWIAGHISVQIRIATGEADWVLGDESLIRRAVVTRTIEVQSSPIVFTAGELVGR
jgi:hypothetical protein